MHVPHKRTFSDLSTRGMRCTDFDPVLCSLFGQHTRNLMGKKMAATYLLWGFRWHIACIPPPPPKTPKTFLVKYLLKNTKNQGLEDDGLNGVKSEGESGDKEESSAESGSEENSDSEPPYLTSNSGSGEDTDPRSSPKTVFKKPTVRGGTKAGGNTTTGGGGKPTAATVGSGKTRMVRVREREVVRWGFRGVCGITAICGITLDRSRNN